MLRPEEIVSVWRLVHVMLELVLFKALCAASDVIVPFDVECSFSTRRISFQLTKILLGDRSLPYVLLELAFVNCAHCFRRNILETAALSMRFRLRFRTKECK